MTDKNVPFSDRPDSRPILVSLLGGAWVLLGFFGCLNALVGAVGAVDGIDFGATDPARAEWAELEAVDTEAYEERMEMEAARIELGRDLSLPLALVALCAVAGGIRLLRRASFSRTLLLLAGVGAVVVSTLFALGTMEIAVTPAAEIGLPPDIARAFHATALAQVLIQSLPVLIGMSLLRHPIVSRFVGQHRAVA